MKTCSKCGVEKGEGEFTKSTRYKDGLFCQCKECVRKTRDERLAANLMCSKCGKEPHRPNMPYCMACSRALSGRAPEPKFHRDKENKTMCSRCKVNPRLPYHNYCQECKNASTNLYYSKSGGWKNMDAETKQKYLVRRFLKWKIDNGSMERKPCEVCGNPDSQGHHHKGYDREHALDVVWLCPKHHKEVHQKMKVDSSGNQ